MGGWEDWHPTPSPSAEPGAHNQRGQVLPTAGLLGAVGAGWKAGLFGCVWGRRGGMWVVLDCSNSQTWIPHESQSLMLKLSQGPQRREGHVNNRISGA